MTSQLRSRYDIVINGGGIVGFTLLKLLQRSPYLNCFRVLLIEQAKKPSSVEQPARSISDNQTRFSNRVSSINLASKTAFKELGVWDIVRPYTKDITSLKDRLSYALLNNVRKQLAWYHKLQYVEGSKQGDSIELKIEKNETGEGQTVSADSAPTSKPTNRIEQLIRSSNKRVFVFMKGHPEAPACGYSNAVVQILDSYGVEFDSFNVLSDDEVRQEVKAYSNWPTIPQVYVDGSFIGGCDILIQMHENNELESMLSAKK